MKQRILIVGSGFAGMWAAVSAARLAWVNQNDTLEITVLSPQPELRVRPRFYEDNVASLVAPLQPLFDELNVNYLEGYAERIDEKEKIVWYRNSLQEITHVDYDRLILASGSHTQRANVHGINEFTFDIDQLASAQVLEKHLQSLPQQPESEARNTVVVCGGGFTGIELATELPARLRQIFGDDTKTKSNRS
ncbi:NADH dehydrogenase-like protein SAV0941 [Yokenella regensburgei]|nr:NADH dehydrogenase-like protein SAV0941 [Yokenella regensburgei]